MFQKLSWLDDLIDELQIRPIPVCKHQEEPVKNKELYNIFSTMTCKNSIYFSAKLENPENYILVYVKHDNCKVWAFREDDEFYFVIECF